MRERLWDLISMSRYLKRAGLWLGYVLALGSVLGILVTTVQMSQAFSRIAATEGVASPEALRSDLENALCYGSVGLLALPVGAFLIVSCLSSLLREKPPERLSPAEIQKRKQLARRRTSAAVIDWGLIPCALGAALHICSRAGGPDWPLPFVVLPYLLLKDSLWGRSLGKLCTGLRAVHVSKRPPTILQSFQRNLPLLLPIVHWVAIAEILAYRRQRIGEEWAGTRVELIEKAS